MGRRGRFGKYGEIKRADRLRRARIRTSSLHRSDIKPLGRGPSFKKSAEEKTGLRIRPAGPSDARFVVQLSGRVFHVYGPYERIIKSWFESGMTVTLIGLLNKKPVAFAMISHLPHEENQQHVSELLAIAVVPEEQRMGIGEMLLKEMERKAAEMNTKELFLHTAEENMAAHKLFSKNGYYSWGIKKNFYPAGQDAVFMSKEIRGEAQS